MSILKKAESTMAFFKAGFLGFQGTGKTYTATLLAMGICKLTGNMKVAFFDTETGSDFLLPKLTAEKIETFQVKSRSFSDLLQTIKDCEKENIPVLIVDSITHVWRDLCESYDKKLQRKGRLQFQDWAIIKGEWKVYTDLFVNSKVHIIVCGRAGFEYDYDFNEDGTKDLIKTGTKMKVENEFGFEPSLVVEMERATAARDELEESHEIKNIKERQQKKQEIRAKVGSKWIHRAHVLKDRTDTLDGQSFDYPTFKDFLPHFQALNIGGVHMGVDTTRTSEDRFDKEGKPEWKREQEQKKIALEEIESWLTTYFPGTSGKEKKAKIAIINMIFGKPSWSYVESLKLPEVQIGRNRIKAILEVPENIQILLGELAGEIKEPKEKGNGKEVDCPELGKKVDELECVACPIKEGCPAQVAQ
jgi:hypothetical protein